MTIGQLAQRFELPDGMRCVSASVMSIVKWDKEASEPEYRGRLQCDEWEVVVPELVFEPEG